VLFNGSNGYTGATAINDQGILQLGIDNAIPSMSAVAVSAGATLDLNGFSDAVGSIANGMSGGGLIDLRTGNLTTGGDNSSTSFDGVIEGTGGLRKIGGGTLTLSGDSFFFSGNTVLSDGALAIGGNVALGTGRIFLDGGSLQSSASPSGQITLFNAFSVDKKSVVSGSNRLTFTGSGTLAAELVIMNTSMTSFGGPLAGSGALTVDAGSGSTVVLAAANEFQGETTIKSGTLKQGLSGALSQSSAVMVMGPGILDMDSLDATIPSLAGSVEVSLETGILTTGLDNKDTQFSGNIGGPGGLVKVGIGKFSLSGTYDLSGSIRGTQIIGGMINFNGPVNSLGNDLLVNNGMANFSSGAPISLPTLMLGDGGMLSGIDPLMVTADMQWTGGTISGSVDVNPVGQGEAQLEITGNLPKYLTGGGTLKNRPGVHIIWMGAGGIWLSGHTTVQNEGTVDSQDGSHFVFNGADGDSPQVVNAIGGTINSSGTIGIDAGVTFTNDGTVNSNLINAGALDGSGTVNGNVTNMGQVTPGDVGMTGILTINGDYTQKNSGSLNLSIGGANPGTGYDQLVVRGTANLDGTLNVTIANNFMAMSGSMFQIMTFGSINGNFANPNLGAGFMLQYDPMDVTLRAN